jgi:hypothetical protein
LPLASGKVNEWRGGGHMVSIDEELKAAKAAKAAINAVSTSTKSAVLATLGKAKNAAILNLSSGGTLNEARAHAGIALSHLIDDHGPPTPQIIEKAKRAIEAWIWELEALPAA